MQLQSRYAKRFEPTSRPTATTLTERDSVCGEAVTRGDRLHRRQIWPSSHNYTTGVGVTSS